MSQLAERIETSTMSDGVTLRRKRPKSRLMMLARRTHLYAGLFLLPWVFLYGVTGAMYNHQSLFPQQSIHPVPRSVLESSRISEFPLPEDLAVQVVEAIQAIEGGNEIRLAPEPNAEFTNDLMFEVHADGQKHVAHIDPLGRSAFLATHPPQDFKPERMLQTINNIQLGSDPMGIARESASTIFAGADISTSETPRPFGWTKLNFLASVDSQPVRITYVLKDGHIDVTKYEGHHGMSTRGFFLRLHTSHGQTPHWNGRMLWSFFVDAMAIAMVTWGLTGLLMWWQIKRTRRIGAAVMAFSVCVALAMYLIMTHFYATTML